MDTVDCKFDQNGLSYQAMMTIIGHDSLAGKVSLDGMKWPAKRGQMWMVNSALEAETCVSDARRESTMWWYQPDK